MRWLVARLPWLVCLMGWCAHAASTWNGPPGGDLDVAANWSPAGVPGDNATANFSNEALDTSGLTMTASGNLGGGVGCTFNVTQTNALTLVVNGGSCRLAGITVAAGAGALTFANGTGNGIVLGGGNANVTLPVGVATWGLMTKAQNVSAKLCGWISPACYFLSVTRTNRTQVMCCDGVG